MWQRRLIKIIAMPWSLSEISRIQLVQRNFPLYSIWIFIRHRTLLYFWTEKGALLHAKSLNTDKAWEVYDYLVDFYFRAKETEKSVAKPEPKPERKPPMMTVVDAPENLQIQKAMEEMRKYLTTVEVLMKEASTYCPIEKYERIMGSLDILWTGMGHQLLNLLSVTPKQIQKRY